MAISSLRKPQKIKQRFSKMSIFPLFWSDFLWSLIFGSRGGDRFLDARGGASPPPSPPPRRPCVSAGPLRDTVRGEWPLMGEDFILWFSAEELLTPSLPRSFPHYISHMNPSTTHVTKKTQFLISMLSVKKGSCHS